MPNIFNISSSLPFLETLADFMLEKFNEPETGLAKCRIFLPTRRSCNALKHVLSKKGIGGCPVLLPRIIPLGDVDEDELALSDSFNSGFDELLVQKEIPDFRARLKATELITEIAPKHFSKFFSIDQALSLADSLLKLLSEFETYDVNREKFHSIFEADISEHWQKISAFLEDFCKQWSNFLDASGYVTKAARRKNLTLAMAKEWQDRPPAFPVIAAGSSGSIPATATLLNVISGLDKGAVILSGLDDFMNEEMWNEVNICHPQHALYKLIKMLGATPSEVTQIKNDFRNLNREKLVSDVMLPAVYAASWLNADINEKSVYGINIVTSETLAFEAKTISLIFKKCEYENKSVALITQNRTLARMVSAEAKRYDINVDDSAGTPLLLTPNAIFFMLIAKYISGSFQTTHLLAMLKHPLFRMGAGQAAQVRAIIRELEIENLRGVKIYSDISQLAEEIEKKSENVSVKEFARKLCECITRSGFSPDGDSLPLSQALKNHIKLAEEFSMVAEFEKPLIWETDQGEELKNLLDEMLEYAELKDEVGLRSYAHILELLMGNFIWHPKYGEHPTIGILSPIEARLLHFDTVIVGGLNDGDWPELGKDDVWASNFMRDKLGLPTLEKRLGQSAHDFTYHLSSPEVYLTYANKSGGVNVAPSRFLSRLETFLKIKNMHDSVIEKSMGFAKLAVEIDEASNIYPCAEPKPNPAVNLRPGKIYVTEVERLIRNPYAFYARKILNLKALDEIDKEPDAMDFGTLMHNAFRKFTDNYNDIAAESRVKFITETATGEIADFYGNARLKAIWVPRIENIAKLFVTFEEQSREHKPEIFAEVEGELCINFEGRKIVLAARADRIEILQGSTIRVIDYKTASTPAIPDVKNGIAPQLPLTALLAVNGGFYNIHASDCDEVAYWQLRGFGEEKQVIIPVTANTIIDASDGARKILEAFLCNQTPFLVSPFENLKKGVSEYYHLERQDEWMINN